MGKPLSKDDKVICQYYNTPDKRFYGSTFTAIIRATDNDVRPQLTPARKFIVELEDGRLQTMVLQTKNLILF